MEKIALPGAALPDHFRRVRRLTAEAIITRGKADLVTAPSDKSMETYGNLLRTFFNRLKKHHAIPQSPMAAFPRAKAALMSQRASDRLLSSDDLLKIFDPITFMPWAAKYPHLWWGTMIGLYTGARINGVSELKLADIVCEDGT
ncbi:hypothetical protein LU699_13150 [Luteimonas fraxinea]|uniref:Integrase n=1 Tax=Luteimonas fraxinea TaxID=2901869 RepID=A0ABS8UG62_9GAMM|nr:hypothetical protein [Luteimonas fraxinea]MCD9098039.1 hypothetical protein [Luteimonas fraxinea]UHH09236.1 hypothetical protein LU699_13150 [Luteimonas fraxinea]